MARDTVMSSRKMSLSGWRPAVVTVLVEGEPAEPALGPRAHHEHADVGGHLVERRRLTSSSTGSAGDDGWNVMVVFSASSVSSTAPHDEQKFDPSGFRCPQLLQKTSATRRSLPSIKPPVALGVEQRVELGSGRRLDHADPALAVGVVVEALGAVGQVGVHGDDRARRPGRRCRTPTWSTRPR